MQNDLTEAGARLIIIGILDQAEVDLEDNSKTHRDSAIEFFEGRAFKVIARVFGLNERRIRREAREIYNSYEQNTGTKNGKKCKRQQAAKKYRLGEVWGELRQDFQEGGEP